MGNKVQKKGTAMVFYTLFFQIKSIYNLTTPKGHVVMQVLQDDKVINFSKRALHAGTVRNKRLKYTLVSAVDFQQVSAGWEGNTLFSYGT